MANRQLTLKERDQAVKLLDRTRSMLKTLAGNNGALLAAYRRRLIVKLSYDERGTPAQRNKLKKEKWEEQNHCCALCDRQMALKYAELDRSSAFRGYTRGNTRLVHHECHTADQAKKRYR